MAEQADPQFDPTPEPTPDPTPAAPAAPEAATPSPSAKPWEGSPWAADLEAAGFDEATATRVHELWQGKVQPYVTQKEQELGGIADTWAALDDEDQGIATYLAIAEAKYGPEVAQAVLEGLQAHVAAQQPGSEPAEYQTEDEAYQAWYEQQPPWIQEREDAQRAQTEDQTYEQELQQFAPDVVELGPQAQAQYARYVLALEGDVQAAKALWDQEMGPTIEAARQNPELAASLGYTFADAAPATEAPAPPHVLGATGAAGGSAPPTEPQYGSLDEAMDDLFKAVSQQPGSRQA